MKKHILIILAVLNICINSCKSYEATRENISEKIIDTLQLSNFDVYAFKLCKTSSIARKSDYSSENLAFPFFELCKDDDALVVEETYLLVPKPTVKSNIVIYITSLSHKYLYKGKGVFNCPLFQDKIFIEDVDMVYLGTIEGNQLNFYQNVKNDKNRHVSKWNFERDSLDPLKKIKIVDVTLAESKFNPKPQIILSETFSTDIVFKKENRKIIYGKNKSTYQKCFEKENLPRIYGKNIGSEVQNLYITNTNFYFSSKNNTMKNEYYKFNIKRLPYYYKFK